MKTIHIYLIVFIGVLFGCEPSFENEARQIGKSGIVVQKHKDEIGCHGSILFKNLGSVDSLTGLCFCVPRETQAVWKYVEVGDSLIKKEGSLEIEIYRKRVKRIFEFPICIQ